MNLSTIITNIQRPALSLKTSGTDIEDATVLNLRFSEDRRVEEVAKLLQTDCPVVVELNRDDSIPCVVG